MTPSLRYVEAVRQHNVDHRILRICNAVYMKKTDDSEMAAARAAFDEGLKIAGAAIGARLREARDAAGKTLEEVAEYFCRTKATIGHWESGRNNLSAAEIALLAHLYKTSAQWLLTGSHPEKLDLRDERLLALFNVLGDDGKTLVLEFAEDRQERESRERAAGQNPRRIKSG